MTKGFYMLKKKVFTILTPHFLCILTPSEKGGIGQWFKKAF